MNFFQVNRFGKGFACLFFFFAFCAPAFSLNYYWVNGSGNWSQFATHWAKIPVPLVVTDYHANIPTADDDLFFLNNGGVAYTVTVDAGNTVPKCHNMDWTGVPAGTVWAGGGGNQDIYGSLTMDANMSMTFSGEVHFKITTGTNTIFSDMVPFSTIVYFEGTGGGWDLLDDFAVTGNLRHSGGLLKTNGHKVSIGGGGSFYGNYYAGENGQLQLGGSEVIVSTGSVLFSYNSSQFNAGTSHIKIFGSQAYVQGPQNFATPIHFYNISFFGAAASDGSGGLAWGHVDGTLTFHQYGAIHANGAIIPELNNVVFMEGALINNAVNYHNLTFTAGKTYIISGYNNSYGTDQTILPGGTLTALGAGTCSQFITIKSWQFGTSFNFVNNSGSPQAVHCTILEDCHATGTNTLTDIDGVDLGGNNTGWIFQAPHVTPALYWVGGAGNWNDPNHWSTTDGGAPGLCIPNGDTDVFITANSGFTTNPGSVATTPIAYCKNMDWTGVTGSPVLDNSYGQLNIYGSMTLAPVGQMSFLTYSDQINMRASGVANFTSNGQYLHTLLLFQGSGAWNFLDAFNVLYVTHIRGEINTKGNPVTIHTWWGNNSYPSGLMNNNGAILRFGDPGGSSSTVNISSQFFCQYEPGMFFTEQSQLVFSNGAQLISHPFSHWDATFTGDGYSNAPSCSFHQMTIAKDGELTGSQTFEKLSVTGGYSYLLQNSLGTGNTITITPSGIFEVLSGSCENRAYFHVANPVDFGYFKKTSGNLTLDWVILDNIQPVATGATYSATNSIGIQTATATAWGITNPTSRNLFWVGGDGNWHDSNHWSLSSNGGGGQCPPTQVDNVRFDGGSGFSAGDKVNVEFTNAFCKTMDWTGAPGYHQLFSPYSGDPTYGHHMYIFGDLILAPDVTNYGGTWVFMATQPSNIFSAGNRLRNWARFWAADGDWTLLDDFAVWIDVLHEYGTIRTAPGADISVGRFWNGNPQFLPDTELWLGNSTMYLKGDCCADGGTGQFFYHTDKFHAGTSNIVLEQGGYINTSQYQYLNQPVEFNNITFKGIGQSLLGGRVAGKLIFEKSGNIHTRTGSLPEWSFVKEAQLQGDVSFLVGPRDFHILQLTPGHRYTFEPGISINIVPMSGMEGQFIAQGLPGQYIELKSSDPAQQAFIHMDDLNGTSTCTKYLFLTGMNHTGTEDIYVPTPGGDVQNNTGWQFFPCNPCPASIPALDVAASITSGCPPGAAKLALAGLKPDETAYWYTDPAATTNLVYQGMLSNPDGGNMFMPTITGPTTYYARVYSDGGLCESTVVLAVDITISAPPTVFNVTGGGSGCQGTLIPVGLDGSQVGVTYHLLRDGVEVGSVLANTGMAFSFGYQTVSGTYTVVASLPNASCTGMMIGSAVVTVSALLAPMPSISTNSPICAGSGTNLNLMETGAGATMWAWTGPAGFASNVQNPIIANPTTAYTGIYTVVVTAADGCTNLASENVDILPQPIVNPKTDTIVCSSATVPNIFFSGSPGTSITWTNSNPAIGLAASGANFIPSFISTNTGSSNLTATITVTPHTIFCTGTPITFNITVKPSPIVDITDGFQVQCGPAFYTQPITFTSNIPGTTFTWTNVNPSIGLAMDGVGDIASFLALGFGPSGNYTMITVTPSSYNGCPGIPSQATIEILPAPDMDFPSDQTVCNGAMTAAVNFMANIPGTTFSWTNSDPTIGLAASGTGNSIPAFTAVNAGSSPVTANILIYPVGPNGCYGPPAGFNITVLGNGNTVIPNVMDASCHGGNDGSIFISATGNGPFSYVWFDGPGSNFHGNLGAGNYIVNVIDNCGNSLVLNVAVGEPSPLSVVANANPPLCLGQINGSIGLSGSGGTPGYNFSWIGPGGFASNAQNITGLEVGNYSLTVADANGCTVSQIVFVPAPIFSVFNSILEPTTCTTTDGAINLLPIGGGPFSYNWLGAGTVNGQQNQTGLSYGMYMVTVTNSNGCTISENIMLNGPGGCGVCPAIGSLVSSPVSTACQNMPVSLTAAGLVDMGTFYGVQFKYSQVALPDPYFGGTTFATVNNAALTSLKTVASASGSFPASGNFFVYAILSPRPIDPSCLPFLSLNLAVNAEPVSPVGNCMQSFCASDNPTIASLAPNGPGILWYDVATGGVPLSAGTPLVNGGHYYASQTVGGCESTLRLHVMVGVVTPAPGHVCIGGCSN